MNFLELVNRLEAESGTVGRQARTADVAAPPTDRQAKMVGWVRQAWQMLQMQRTDWSFMVGEFERPLTIGKTRYDAFTDWAIPRFSDWVVDNPVYSPVTMRDPTLGFNDEGELRQATFEYWRQTYDRGTPQVQRPTVFAVDRDRRFCVGDTPDKAYVVRGEYRKAPQILAASTDIPDMPADYHEAIVWRALMLLGGHDESPVTIGNANGQFAPYYSGMVKRCVPTPTLGGNSGYFG